MEQTTCEAPPQLDRRGAGDGVRCDGHSTENHPAEAETADTASATSESRPLSTAEIEKRLEEEIVRRTHGLVRSPRVRALNGAFVLDGFAPSYYAVQLALAAMLGLFDRCGCDRPDEIHLAIDVADT